MLMNGETGSSVALNSKPMPGLNRMIPAPVWHPFPVGEHTLWEPFDSEGDEGIVVAHLLQKAREVRFVMDSQQLTARSLGNALDVASGLAISLGARSLVTQDKIPYREELAVTFAERGFRALDESCTFEIPFRQLAVRVNALHQRLAKHHALPEHASLEPLLPHVHDVGVALEAAQLMDAFQLRARLEDGAKKHISAEHSCVLLIGGELVGTILVAQTSVPGTYEIPIRWVAPTWRQTSINAMLIHYVIARGCHHNAQFVRFNANSVNHRETIRLASKAGGHMIGTSHRYGFAFSAGND